MCYSVDSSLLLLGAELVLTGLYTLYIPFAGPLSRQMKGSQANPFPHSTELQELSVQKQQFTR